MELEAHENTPLILLLDSEARLEVLASLLDLDEHDKPVAVANRCQGAPCPTGW